MGSYHSTVHVHCIHVEGDYNPIRIVELPFEINKVKIQSFILILKLYPCLCPGLISFHEISKLQGKLNPCPKICSFEVIYCTY